MGESYGFFAPSMNPIYLFLLVALKAWQTYQQYKKDNPKTDPLESIKAHLAALTASNHAVAASVQEAAATPAATAPAASADPRVISANVPLSFRLEPTIQAGPSASK